MRKFGYQLYAEPSAFWDQDVEKYLEQCNGCGSDDTVRLSRWLGVGKMWDSLLGVRIAAACSIHDYMYSAPEDPKFGITPSEEHRAKCDRVFRNNMFRILEVEGKRRRSWAVTRWARRQLALGYYSLVRRYGATAYWKEKNGEAEFPVAGDQEGVERI